MCLTYIFQQLKDLRRSALSDAVHAVKEVIPVEAGREYALLQHGDAGHIQLAHAICHQSSPIRVPVAWDAAGSPSPVPL